MLRGSEYLPHQALYTIPVNRATCTFLRNRQTQTITIRSVDSAENDEVAVDGFIGAIEHTLKIRATEQSGALGERPVSF